MNVERLHNILRCVAEDADNENFGGVLDELVGHLQQLATEPNNESHQNNVSDSRSKLSNVLIVSKINQYPPSWIRSLEEMNLYYYVPRVLMRDIDEAFAGNEITPAATHKELKSISTTYNEIKSTVSEMTTGFENLNIGREELGDGECEISLSIPHKAINSDILKFGDEIRNFHRLISPFTELVAGKPQNIKVKTISSTELVVTIQILSESVAWVAGATSAVAMAVQRVILAYKEVRDISPDFPDRIPI